MSLNHSSAKTRKAYTLISAITISSITLQNKMIVLTIINYIMNKRLMIFRLLISPCQPCRPNTKRGPCIGLPAMHVFIVFITPTKHYLDWELHFMYFLINQLDFCSTHSSYCTPTCLKHKYRHCYV